MDFVFEAGKFEKLRVVRTFHFGPLQQDLREGTIVEFDGQTMKLGGKSHDASQLGSAVRAGWLTLASGQSQNDLMKPASVMIRPAQSTGNERGLATVMSAASEEERVVGTLGATNARRDEASRKANGAFNPNEGQELVGNLTSMDARRDESSRKANGAFNAAEESPVAVTRSIESAPIEISYPGVGNTPPIGKKFPTVQDDGAGQGGSMVIRTASVVNPQRNPETSSEGVAVATVGSARKTVLITDSAQAAAEISRLDNSPPPKAKKFATVAEGEDIRSVRPGGATGDVSEARYGSDLADLLPDAASTGIPASGVAGEGFSWDTTKGHWMTRVKEAVAKYGTNPVILEKIIELEGPKIGQRIRDSLGKA